MHDIMHGNQELQQGRDIYSALIAPVELQKRAYAEVCERSPRIVLGAYSQSFIHAVVHEAVKQANKKQRAGYVWDALPCIVSSSGHDKISEWEIHCSRIR